MAIVHAVHATVEKGDGVLRFFGVEGQWLGISQCWHGRVRHACKIDRRRGRGCGAGARTRGAQKHGLLGPHFARSAIAIADCKEAVATECPASLAATLSQRMSRFPLAKVSVIEVLAARAILESDHAVGHVDWPSIINPLLTAIGEVDGIEARWIGVSLRHQTGKRQWLSINHHGLGFWVFDRGNRGRSEMLTGRWGGAALAAGAIDRGEPGLRPQYGPSYYAAFVTDPDGYKLEANNQVAAVIDELNIWHAAEQMRKFYGPDASVP
jgi:hypothetical protein